MKQCSIEVKIFRNLIRHNGCWVWQGSLVKGYGQIRHKGKIWYVHRLMYQLYVEELDPILQIDHLCRNRACVNPEHLEQVTCKENIKRMFPYTSHRIGDMWRDKTQCPYGHLYDSANTVHTSQGRQCRACICIRHRRYYKQKRLI